MARRNRHLVRAALLLIGCLLLVALFVRLGPGRVLSLVTSLGWNFLVVVTLFAAHEFVRTLAIRSCLPADRRPRLSDLLRIRFLGEAAGAITRTGSLAAEPARAWLLANLGGQGAPGYSAAAGELMANSAVSAGVNVGVTGCLLLLGHLKGPMVPLAHVLLWGSLVYLGAVVGFAASGGRLVGHVVRATGRLPFAGRWLQVDPVKVRAGEEAIGSILMAQPATIVRILLLELAAQTILVCEVYWAIRSMGVAVSGHSALFIEVMTRAFTIVEFVGATEMGFAVVFVWLGMPAAIGFTLSLVKTLRSLVAAGLVIGVLTAGERLRSGVIAAARPSGAVLDLSAD
jgi:hypothetical protein